MKNLLYWFVFSSLIVKPFEAPAPAGFQWVMPLGQDSGVVFVEGAGNTIAEAATYMVGSSAVDPSFVSPNTQEQVFCDKGITIFKNVCVDPEFPEVVLAPKQPLDWWQACLHPFEILEQDNSRKQYASSGIQIKSTINSSQTQTLSAFSIDRKQVTLGQMPDVEIQQRRAKNFMLRYGNMPQIWHGTSRGAAVTCIAAAIANKSNPDSLKTVRALFLEGCYGSVASDLHKLFKSNFEIWMINTFFSSWYSYKKKGIDPLDVLNDFPRNISTVFITSKTDDQVPQVETDRLVSKLVNAGHENIYYLILENSSHGNYVASNPQDARTYQAFSHALYKELHLPYLPPYAVAGAPLLAIAKKNAQALKKQ
ncbi:hypothetical protein BH09DEP1_BH09DEP1_4770 [soil metagenome]